MKREVKLLIFGDEGAGKTSFVYCAVTGYFPPPTKEYRPPSSGETVKVDGDEVQCHLVEARSVQSVDCPGGHVAAVVVLDTSVASANETTRVHVANIRARFGLEFPIVLAGTKIDVRKAGAGVSNTECIALAKELNVVKFVDVAVTKALRCNLVLCNAAKAALAAPEVPLSAGTGITSTVLPIAVPKQEVKKIVHAPYAPPLPVPISEPVQVAPAPPVSPGRLDSGRLKFGTGTPVTVKQVAFAPPPPPPSAGAEAVLAAEPPKESFPRPVGKLVPGRFKLPSSAPAPTIKQMSVFAPPPSMASGEGLPVHTLIAAIPAAYQRPFTREKLEEISKMLEDINAKIPPGFLERPLWLDLNGEEIVAAYVASNGGDYRNVVDFPRHFNTVVERFLNKGIQSLLLPVWTQLLKEYCPTGRILISSVRTRAIERGHTTYFDGKGSMVFELSDWASNSLNSQESIGWGYNRDLPRPPGTTAPGVPRGSSIGLCNPCPTWNWHRVDNMFMFEERGLANLARIKAAVGISKNVVLECPDLAAMDDASDVNIPEEEAQLGRSAKPGQLIYQVVLGLIADALERSVRENQVVAKICQKEWTTGILRLEYDGKLILTPGAREKGNAEKMPPGPLYDNGYWSLKRESGILPNGVLYVTMQRHCDYGRLGQDLIVGTSLKYLDLSVQRPRYRFPCSKCDQNGFKIRTYKQEGEYFHTKESCAACNARGVIDYVE